MSTTVRHLGSGKYSDVFRVARRGAPAVVMKVSYYRDDTICDVVERAKRGDTRGALRLKQRDAVQVASRFAKLTRLLMRHVSPHFVLVFCDADCKSFASRMAPLLKARMGQLSTLQKRYNNVCFMEVFDTNMTKLLVRGSYDEGALRAMIFQVVYTLAALQRLLPGFRHNDLSTNNVLVKRVRAPATAAYRLGHGPTFYVKASVFTALSDYDFTNVPGKPGLVNERVHSGKFKVDGRRNDSYDTHFFLKSVLKCIQRRLAQFPETTRFLHRLKLREEDRQNSAVLPHLAPATLLRDAYFAPLQAKPAAQAVVASYAA